MCDVTDGRFMALGLCDVTKRTVYCVGKEWKAVTTILFQGCRKEQKSIINVYDDDGVIY